MHKKYAEYAGDNAYAICAIMLYCIGNILMLFEGLYALLSLLFFIVSRLFNFICPCFTSVLILLQYCLF